MAFMIKFEGVSKKFGDYTVLDQLRFVYKRGKITFILGKSGEGKSVTIKHIMGLMKPNKGQIIVDGQEITSLSLKELRYYRRSFGLLFQHAALFDSLTVAENIVFPLVETTRLKLNEMLEKVDDILQRVGLSNIKHKYTHELSTGEKKRVGLARALITKPKVILYDEPTTGMDPLVCEMIDKLIKQMGKETPDLTSVVISHDLKAALATADEIIMLYKGKVALAGTPDDFMDK